MSTIKEEKFQRILDAAIEAIAEAGYHQCQVSKIARLAGVADGTIYLYFKGKEDILIRLFQERMGDFISLIRSQLHEGQTTRERLRAIVGTHFSYMEENRSLAIVTQLELRQSNPQVRASITGPLLDYFRLIEEVIRDGMEKGEVGRIDVRVARQMIFGALDEATTDWVLSRTQRTLKSGTEPMLELFEGALRLVEVRCPKSEVEHK